MSNTRPERYAGLTAPKLCTFQKDASTVLSFQVGNICEYLGRSFPEVQGLDVLLRSRLGEAKPRLLKAAPKFASSCSVSGMALLVQEASAFDTSLDWIEGQLFAASEETCVGNLATCIQGSLILQAA